MNKTIKIIAGTAMMAVAVGNFIIAYGEQAETSDLKIEELEAAAYGEEWELYGPDRYYHSEFVRMNGENMWRHICVESSESHFFPFIECQVGEQIFVSESGNTYVPVHNGYRTY